MSIDFNKEQVGDAIKIILTLEWLGVRIEDVKEESESSYLFSTTKKTYYYSVPESSTIEVADAGEDLNQKIKTADGLIHLAKKELTDVIVKACEYYGDKDFTEEVKNNISDYCKFYAKVRKGEVWTKELGDNRVKELTDDLQKASGYQEI